MLIVFGGLPGTGKTTLARQIAAELAAAYLRIDSIEEALRSSGVLAGGVGPAGYVVAYALAESNLRLGRPVVADSVNPVAATRAAWRRVATTAAVPLVEIEIICSDLAEHRRRVEARTAAEMGGVPPTWQEVVERDYEPWDGPRIVIDTADRTIDEALGDLRSAIDRALGR